MKHTNRNHRNISSFSIFTLILCSILISCSDRSGNTSEGKGRHIVSIDSTILDGYVKQTAFTDPGEFAFLYENLPKSFNKVCDLIKIQLIHPMEAREMGDILPEGRGPEDGDFPNVSSMLRELVMRDSSGLTMARKPEDRLIVACYHHALFLASICRYQNIPVRLRGGFARYYEKEAEVRFGHVVCEVWNADEKCWVMIDPDRNIIDVTTSRFEFPSTAWQHFYGTEYRNIRHISSVGEGFQALIHILLLDQSFVLSNERNYWHTPEFVFNKNFNFNNLEEKQVQTINEIAQLMAEPEINITQLQQCYDKNSFLHARIRSVDAYYERIEDKPLNNID